MAGQDHPTHANTAPGDATASTRQPSQLSVLLAGAGTPPLVDPEQARIAPIRLFDAFVFAPERARLFFGADFSLFKNRTDVTDPRHDGLARVMRAVAASLRQRLEQYDSTNSGPDLVRGVAPLSAARIESALTGYDLRRASATVYTADVMLGPTSPDVDPLDAPDAGIIRRFLALATRGLMIERPSSRAGGVITDLGGVALSLALLDLVANPRSALRAARARLAKAGKLGDDEIARVRDVGQALREILGHAVSSATTANAAGRELVKEATLSAEVMDHFAVSLARAVYDGLAPSDEHPLVVAGAGATDALTVAPLLAPATGDDPQGGPTLGAYNRIAFVPLPYARALPGDPVAAESYGAPIGKGATLVGTGSPSRDENEVTSPNAGMNIGALAAAAAATATAPRAARGGAALDEGALTRARESLRKTASFQRAPAGFAFTMEAQIDPADARHAWRRATPNALPAQIVRAAEQGPAATHVAVIVGPRATLARDVVEAFGNALAQGAPWIVLGPRATDRTLAFEALEHGANAGPALRRSDVSRWLDPDATRAIHWDAQPGALVAVNAAALDDAQFGAMDSLCNIARDIADKADPRAILLLVGAPSYAAAAAALGVLSRRPDLENGEVPLRAGSVWLVRTDAPVAGRIPAGRAYDEATLVALGESLVGSPGIAEVSARAALIPAEAKYRGRAVRLAALAAANNNANDGFAAARRALERASAEPWNGVAMRRTLQAGVGSLATVRAALSAGMTGELLQCARHEAALVVAEYETQRTQSTHAARLADVARGALAEIMMAAHPRTAVLAHDGVLAHVPAGALESVEKSSILDALHSGALGARAGGSVYTRDERGAVPLGFVVRSAADLYALVEVTVGPVPTRVWPAAQMELSWRLPAGERETSLGAAAQMVAVIQEVARRMGQDLPARMASREGRPTYCALIDFSLDAALRPEGARFVIPLRPGAAEADVQRFAVELVARMADAVGGNIAAEWSAQTTIDSKGPAAIALTGPLLLRDFVTRWTRALRVLPRHFPAGGKASTRYSNGPVVASGAELGIATAVLQERGINPNERNGRALMARIPTAAPEVMAQVRELLGQMPVLRTIADGSDWEVLERALAVAWFLHVNFCCTVPGAIQWAPADAPNLRTMIEQHLDASALRPWLSRKTARPDMVEQRVQSAMSLLEPSFVIDS